MSSANVDTPDPFDLELYMKQRFNEFFGSDLWSVGDWLLNPTASTGLSDVDPSNTIAQSESASGPIVTESSSGPANPSQGDYAKQALRRNRSQKILDRTPKLDIKQMKDFYLLKMDLPGAKKENIQVYIDDRHVLHVEADMPNDMAELMDQEKMLLSERAYGKVSRQLRLPRNADPERVETVYECGVLGIRFGKKQEERKLIPVN